MGVYIPGMKMPKNEAVALYIYPDGRAKLWRPQAAVSHEFEAVPVPAHGRMIDADAIRADIDEKKRPGRSYEDAWALTVIDAAPTIIPAEEGDT